MKKLHGRLYSLEPKDISFDVDNPRGLSKEQIIHAPAFKRLVASIKEHGILEPLIIKSDLINNGSYILIDGERRLRAALEAETKEVPALVAKDDTDGRILAYQVHMLRDDWDKAAETKAIKKIISDVDEQHPEITEPERKKKICEITGHTSSEVNDLFRLIKYDNNTIDKVIKDELHMSYLIHIDQSFLVPLSKNYEEILDKFGEHKIREIMVNKALDGNLVNTRFLMDKFKYVFSDLKNKAEIEKLLIKFLKEKDLSIKEVYDKQQKLVKRAEKKQRKAANPEDTKKKKTSAEGGSKGQVIFMPKKINVSQKELTQITDVREKFELIGGMLSAAEIEYISEALKCLEHSCFKAATLMGWSAGISRLHDFVERNLADFNKATDDMRANKRSAWKPFADQFQKAVADIEELRVRSNDTHLLCYLVYKKLITGTQFDALRANYKTRCNCAHPTDMTLSANATISVFENIYDYILNNVKLK